MDCQVKPDPSDPVLREALDELAAGINRVEMFTGPRRFFDLKSKIQVLRNGGCGGAKRVERDSFEGVDCVDDIKSNIQVCETPPIITGGGGQKIQQGFEVTTAAAAGGGGKKSSKVFLLLRFCVGRRSRRSMRRRLDSLMRRPLGRSTLTYAISGPRTLSY
jgi:hypothetical protein